MRRGRVKIQIAAQSLFATDNEQVQPLGDQAILTNHPDEATAARWAAAVRRAAPPWLVDVVLAYSSVAVYFSHVKYAVAAEWLTNLTVGEEAGSSGQAWVLPCCYEMGPDLEAVAKRLGLSPDMVVELHAKIEYQVFAVGFCPGFPYMGYLPEPLAGVPRLDVPRLRVEPGSVGVTGRQTGIYPLERPGGWHLIGRSPTTLVDLARGFIALSPGDRVRFQPIGRVEYEQLMDS